MSTKPREFWLEIFLQDDSENMVEANCYHRKPKHWPKKPHGLQVHVIEHSAYQDLEQKLALAVEALEQISNIEVEEYEGEPDEYLTLLITKSTANQALAKIKKWQGLKNE